MTNLIDLIEQEKERQNNNVELIASENFTYKEVLDAQGSILTNKYAEGYPNKRYYGGCEIVDKIELYGQELANKLFNCKFSNLQPHSGSSANFAVYSALLEPGDKVLGMSLDSGGHLTHGYSISFSGIFYETEFYDVDPETKLLDYEKILEIAKKFKPKMIIAGASSYSREIDFKKFREIADEINAYLFVDMAHIAGLVAANQHQSPFPHAHVVTSTTHKTLRGARGGIILTNDESIATKIDKAVFPGLQGGPLMHAIAGKAFCFEKALEKDYKIYIQNVIKNAKAMTKIFIENGYNVLTNGTDNHLFLVDVFSKSGKNGAEVSDLLEKANITLNKNSIPFDKKSPKTPSGIRIGTPAITTRGCTQNQAENIAKIIIDLIENDSENNIIKNRKNISEIVASWKKVDEI